VAEKLVDTAVFQAQPEATLLPYFMVEAFTVMPGSAWPGSCTPYYDIDYPAVKRYLDANRTLAAHMDEAPELREARHD